MSYGGIIGQQPALEASGISYNNNQTSSIITGDNVQTAIDQLFTSVSNGKNKIASAITDKGISTSPSDSFDVMAGNIGKIVTEPKLEDFESIQRFNVPNAITFLNEVKITSQSGDSFKLNFNSEDFRTSGLYFWFAFGPQLDMYPYSWGGIVLEYDPYGNLISFNSFQKGSEVRKIEVNASGNSKLTSGRIRLALSNTARSEAEFSFNFSLPESQMSYKAITKELSWPLEQ